MESMRGIILVFALVLLLAALGCATLQEDLADILNTGTVQDGSLDEPTVIAGIKEALRVGTQNTVLSTSQLDGYLGNQLIRIVIPEQLESMASTLRQVGLGSQVAELEVGMNRAAELAAAEAREVFWDAITGMTVADAFGILKGDDTAATDYFRSRTQTALYSRFHAIVQEKMDEVGLSRMYGKIVDTYNSLPMAGMPQLVDLDEYVTDRALAGLFTVLAQEERKIRQDPLARTSDLLRRVFGS